MLATCKAQDVEGWHDHGGSNSWQVWPASNYWHWGTNLYVATDLYAVFYSHILTNYPSGQTNAQYSTNMVHFYIGNTNGGSVTTSYIYALGRYDPPTNWYMSNVVYVSVADAVQTNVHMQPRDVWAYDLYKAATERFLTLPSPLSVKFYKSLRSDLVDLKSAIESSLDSGKWVDTNNITINGIGLLTVTGEVARYNLPSNYLDWTCYSQFNGVGVGEQRVVTGSWTVVGATTGIVTNSVHDACGNATTITGTNGQVVTFVCTNDYIASGYTSLNYGVEGLRSIINDMVWRNLTTLWTLSESSHFYGYCYANSSFEDAQACVGYANLGPSSLPKRWTYGIGSWDLTADGGTGRWYTTSLGATNYYSEAVLYVQGTKPFQDQTNSFFNAQGDSIIEGWFPFATNAANNDATNYWDFTLGAVQPTNYLDPAVVGENSYGYNLEDTAVYKFNITNGFKYVP